MMDSEILVSYFALGLFLGALVSLVNIITSAFARWVMSGS